MNISEHSMEIWCRRATALIRFAPDRWKVYDELQAHLTDHRDALLEQGLTQEDATQKALDAMGSAEELAPQLAALHSPFWGYALRVCRILLVILLVLSLFPIWKYFSSLSIQKAPDNRDFAVYDSDSYGGDTGRTLLHLSQPGTSFSCDGSTFKLTDTALFTVTKGNGEATAPQLYFLVRQTSRLPWSVYEQDYRLIPVGSTFFARDSLGNLYEGFLDHPQPDSHLMYFSGTQSGIFAYTYEFWINDFPADAEWVEIVYERDGRSCSMYIDLTGGGGA